MVEQIDFYDHWNKNRIKKKKPLDREHKSLNLIKTILKKDGKFLDMGCGNGEFMLSVKKRYPHAKLKGLDYSKSEVREAKKQGLDVDQADFEKELKLPNESFDLVYAGEVIEHLYNADYFLEQINNVLKKGGYALISTPNLCTWYNRFLMLFGIQPLFLEPSTKSKMVGSGPLKRFKKEPQPVGHVRIFTYEALKDMFKMHGFEISAIQGAIYDEGFPKFLHGIDRMFNVYPKLASHFIILARKTRRFNKKHKNLYNFK